MVYCFSAQLIQESNICHILLLQYRDFTLDPTNFALPKMDKFVDYVHNRSMKYSECVVCVYVCSVVCMRCVRVLCVCVRLRVCELCVCVHVCVCVCVN